MDKNQKEKQMLYEWGIENNRSDYFQQLDRDSCFEKRQNNSYIRQYVFESLPQIKEELNSLWSDDEAMESIKMVIAVAAMKNKPIKNISNAPDTKDKSEMKDELPVYIYNF